MPAFRGPSAFCLPSRCLAAFCTSDNLHLFHLTAARRKREDNIVQLRKDRRDENLQKKRMVGAVVAAGEMESNRPMMQQKVIKRALSLGKCLPVTLARVSGSNCRLPG